LVVEEAQFSVAVVKEVVRIKEALVEHIKELAVAVSIKVMTIGLIVGKEEAVDLDTVMINLKEIEMPLFKLSRIGFY